MLFLNGRGPWKPGYRYERPFDYFDFEFRLHFGIISDSIMIRGLLFDLTMQSAVPIAGYGVSMALRLYIAISFLFPTQPSLSALLFSGGS